MISRLHAFLFAVFLCCCGILVPADVSHDSTARALQSEAAMPDRALDRLTLPDPMSQAQAESAADGPGLLAEAALPGFTAPRAALPRPDADSRLRPPYLDGLRRPPRTAARLT